MSYMIEGGGSPTLSKAKHWLYRYPDASHSLLHAITDVCVEYLIGQVVAGAQLLQVFESHAGILGANQFGKFSLPYLQKIAVRVKEGLKARGHTPVPMVRRKSLYAHQPTASLPCRLCLLREHTMVSLTCQCHSMMSLV